MSNIFHDNYNLNKINDFDIEEIYRGLSIYDCQGLFNQDNTPCSCHIDERLLDLDNCINDELEDDFDTYDNFDKTEDCTTCYHNNNGRCSLTNTKIIDFNGCWSYKNYITLKTYSDFQDDYDDYDDFD